MESRNRSVAGSRATKAFLALALGAITQLACVSLVHADELPSFDGKDIARKRILVSLKEVAKGFEQITGIEFLPDHPEIAFVLEKQGRLRWTDFGGGGGGGTLLTLKVRTKVEQGLLGLAFHPDFAKNRKFYLNYNPDDSGPMRTRISEWTLPQAADQPGGFGTPTQEKVLLEFDQPFANHKGGQIVFGPDGFLYIGTGDGGSAGDPHGNGQNTKSFLGKMLRIDVNRSEDGKPYAIPKDNPGKTDPKILPEIFAWGLRNPWRFTFDLRGRLVVADVGQDKFEEIDIVEKGKNYGWNIKEGKHCFKPETGCSSEGLVDPIYEYGRDEGGCIIGGFVYTGKAIPDLRAKYLFTDFLTGRVWALDLNTHEVSSLGRWNSVRASAFGQSPSGELYFADFAGSRIMRLEHRPEATQ